MEANSEARRAGEAFARYVLANPRRFTFDREVFLADVMERLEADPKYQTALAELKQHDLDWKEEFGEAPPKTLDDFARWVTRLGEKPSWGDDKNWDYLYPYIEGHLQWKIEQEPGKVRFGDGEHGKIPPKGDDPPASATVNARMIDTLKKKAESRDWTAEQWKGYLSCGKTTVIDSPAWKAIMIERDGVRLEAGAKPKDRHRKTRPKKD